jgi:hypothetical protein
MLVADSLQNSWLFASPVFEHCGAAHSPLLVFFTNKPTNLDKLVDHVEIVPVQDVIRLMLMIGRSLADLIHAPVVLYLASRVTCFKNIDQKSTPILFLLLGFAEDECYNIPNTWLL